MRKPPLVEAAKPALAAYNFVLTWADGNGGVSHADLEGYMTSGEGSYLTPDQQDLARRGVEALIAQDRRLAAEEMEKARKK